MTQFSEISKTDKPDKKIAEYVGKTIDIVSISKKDITWKGEPITFYTLVLKDGSTVGANATVAKQIYEHESSLPFTAKVGTKQSKRGAYSYLE